jgi:hypothetical protein
MLAVGLVGIDARIQIMSSRKFILRKRSYLVSYDETVDEECVY